MFPPSLPGGQPGVPMPKRAPKSPAVKKKKNRRPGKPKNQAAPRGKGGFGVTAPKSYGV
jgi:hypothetical protein